MGPVAKKWCLLCLLEEEEMFGWGFIDIFTSVLGARDFSNVGSFCRKWTV